VLIELVARVLQLVGRYLVNLAEVVDTRAHALGHGGNALGYEDECLLISKIAAGKLAQVGHGGHHAGTAVDGVAHLQHALGQQVGVFAVLVGVFLELLVQG